MYQYKDKSRRFMRLKEVKNRTGYNSTSCIYQMMAEGKFPKQYSLGKRAVGWLESEIEAWIDSRIQGEV